MTNERTQSAMARHYTAARQPDREHSTNGCATYAPRGQTAKAAHGLISLPLPLYMPGYSVVWEGFACALRDQHVPTCVRACLCPCARPAWRCRSACPSSLPRSIILAVRSASYSFCQRAPPFLLFCCCCFHKARMRMNSSIDCQYVRESFAGTTARQKQEQFKKTKSQWVTRRVRLVLLPAAAQSKPVG